MSKFEEYLEAVREAVLLQEGGQYEYSESKRKIGIARPEKYNDKVINYGSFIADVILKLSDFAKKKNIEIRYSEVNSESKGSKKVAMHYLDLGSKGKLYLDVNQENGNVVGYIIHALGGVQFSSGPHRTVEDMVKAVKNFVNKQPSMESFEQINEARGIDIEAIYKAPAGTLKDIFSGNEQKMNTALKKFSEVSEKEKEKLEKLWGKRTNTMLGDLKHNDAKEGLNVGGKDYIFGAYLAEPFEEMRLPFGNTSAPKGQVKDGGDYYGTKTSSGDMKEENDFIYFKNNKGTFQKVFYGASPMKSSSQEGKLFMKYFNNGKIIRRSTQPNILGVKGKVTAYGIGK